MHGYAVGNRFGASISTRSKCYSSVILCDIASGRKYTLYLVLWVLHTDLVYTHFTFKKRNRCPVTIVALNCIAAEWD